jgi:hypothetical protein
MFCLPISTFMYIYIFEWLYIPRDRSAYFAAANPRIIKIAYRIGNEAAQFHFWEYINGIISTWIDLLRKMTCINVQNLQDAYAFACC